MSAPELVSPSSPGQPSPRPAGAPRHLRVVRDDELAAVRRRRRLRVGSVVSVVFVIALLFVAVGMHVMLAQNQFRLDQLDKKAAAEQAKYQQLRLQVDRLSSPQAIVGAAEGRLGMVPAQSVTFLTPSSATSAAPASSASGAAAGTPGAAAAVAAPADAGSGGPAPATAPPGWSTIKPQLADNP